MKRWSLVAAAVLAFVAWPATGRPADSATGNPSRRLDRIGMRTISFWHITMSGSPLVSEWQIARNGEGTFRTIEGRYEKRKWHGTNVTRRFSAGPGGFQQIAGLLQEAEKFAGGEFPCDEISYSDSPQGMVTWVRGGTTRKLEFDQGCPSKAARRIFDRMDKAEKLVTSWGAKGRIVRSEAVSDPAKVE